MVLDELEQEAGCSEQGRRSEIRDICTVTLPDIEHANERQRSYRLSKRAPRQAELLGEILFLGEPLTGPELA